MPIKGHFSIDIDTAVWTCIEETVGEMFGLDVVSHIGHRPVIKLSADTTMWTRFILFNELFEIFR